MNKITINDERISATPAIAVAKENIKVSVAETKIETFDTWDGLNDVEQVALNIIQPAQIWTIKDVDADISNLECDITKTQNQLDDLNIFLQNKKDLRVELEKVVTPAFAANQIAVAEKVEEKPVEELPVEPIAK